MIVLLALAACGAHEGIVDPRPEIAQRLGPTTPTARTVEQALREERAAEACAAARHAVATYGGEDDWRAFLRASSRAVGGACLSSADGGALAQWAAATPERAARWRGERAEWAAANADVDAALTMLADPGVDAARLRVALRRDDAAAAIDAAEGALLDDPGDGLACRVLAERALAGGDLLAAEDAARCAGTVTPPLSRVRAEAAERSGRPAEAATLWRAAGRDLHAAVVLYQDVPGGADAALPLLRDGPMDRLHRGWLALATGGVPDLMALGGTPFDALLRVAADPAGASPELVASLPTGDAAAEVLRARALAARGDRDGAVAALAAARRVATAVEPVHRAEVAVRVALELEVDPALFDWAAQDPDHVRLRGGVSREAPWAAVAPWAWDDLRRRTGDRRARADAPAGQDAIGAAWRAAAALPDHLDRLDALTELQDAHPELGALPGERWRLAAEPPLDATSRAE